MSIHSYIVCEKTYSVVKHHFQFEEARHVESSKQVPKLKAELKQGQCFTRWVLLEETGAVVNFHNCWPIHEPQERNGDHAHKTAANEGKQVGVVL